MKNLLITALLAIAFSSSCVAEDIKKTNTEVILDEQSDFNDEFANEFEEEKEVFDPLSGYNRVMTSFNDFVYLELLEPTAKGYAYILPEPARVGISNFFYNLIFPVRFANNILQLKFENAFEETGRFLINSTFGLAGFLDPATTEFSLDKHTEDFGQTLGHYGVGEGFHIVIPFIGPSNARDIFRLVGDGYVTPLTHVSAMNYKIPNNLLESVGILTYRELNRASLNPGKYENLKKDAIDLYPFLRDIYNQNREKAIRE